MRRDGPEFCHNEDGTVDEVFVPATFVHIEQMDDNAWWMGITQPDGELVHVNLWTPRTRIRLNYNQDGLGPEGGEFGSGVVLPTHSQVRQHGQVRDSQGDKG